jgi:hypothetical protein
VSGLAWKDPGGVAKVALHYHREVADGRLVQVDLTKDERRVLEMGLIEWAGPAACTNEMALAMGFTGVRDLFDDGSRLANSIRDDDPLTPRDWTRALLATEMSSPVMSWGRDSIGCRQPVSMMP